MRALRRTCARALGHASVPLCVLSAIMLAGAGSAHAVSPPTGALSQLPSPANCVGEEEEKIAECGTKVQSGLTLPYQVKVSPDGRNAYSVSISGGLTEYTRNPATGALSVIGCITAAAKACAATNSVENVSIMAAPTSLAISPNGQNVYVTAQTANAVVELEREPMTGLLTIMGGGKACVSGGSSECEKSDAKGFSVPYGVAISPDEKSVYVTSAQGEEMAELERSLTTGLLTPISGHECIGAADTGCPEASAVGLFEPIGVTVSPDGKNVYVAAGASGERGDVAEFSRASSGVLTQLSGENACVSSKITECKTIDVLEGSEDLVVSPDGKNVYATSFPNSALVELERDSSTGALTQLGSNNRCVSVATIEGCAQAKGIGGTRGVAISPNGVNVYVGSTSENSVAAFSREESSGALTPLESPHECVSSGSSGEECGSHTLVGLVGTRRLTVSPDGTNVYVAAQGDNAIAELARAEAPSVSEVTPNEGEEAGGTKVTIKGNGFIEGAKVFFGAKEATAVSIESGTEITAKSPAAKRGPVDVTVKTSEGTSLTTSADQYFYVPPHKLGGLFVNGYCESLGDHGNGSGPSKFLKGGIGGPEFAFHNWACVKDDGTAVEITETGPAPSFEDMCAFQYPTASGFGYPSDPNNAFSWNCYANAPQVLSLKPLAVATSGGGPITIRGEHLKGASQVTFGGTAGEITSVGENEVTAEAPAHVAGQVDVVVSTLGGESAKSSADHITYVSGPAINKVEPQEGPEAGGTKVKIHGEFLEAGTVKFGGTAAKLLRESATELEVETPSHAAGAVEVEFSGPAGKTSGGPSNRFTYEALVTPAVSAISPNEGPTVGETAVKITGSGFTKKSEVKFGATAASEVEFKSASELVATSPGGTGTVDVRVKTEGGTSPTGAGDEFTYRAAPTVTKIDPSEGPTGGETAVKITGANFTSASEVEFGGTAASEVEFKSSGELVAKSPAGSGTVDVRVKTAGGTSAKGTADEFTYRGLPAVSAISPNEGPETGGTAVTVTGLGFTRTSEVNFGSKAGTEVEFKSSTELVVQSPEGAGTVHLTVKTAGGTSTTGSPDQFTYRGVPAVSSISPNEGPTSGATKVTILGTNLTSTSEVKFGSTKATEVEFKSAGELIAKSPAGTGTVHVTVKTAGGTSTTGTADEFTYRLLPSVSSISPNEGPEAGGTSVKISGANFTSASEVKFGTKASTEVEFKSSGELIAKSPSGTGTVHVMIKTAGGTSTLNSADQFTYRGVPSVSAVSPKEGPETGGTIVTIDGANLEAATHVTFGGVAARIVTDTAGAIEAESPADHTPGPVDIVVTTEGGSSTTGSADQFTYRGVPSVSSISPNEGPEAGGTSVKILGTNFTSASEVKFGTKASTEVEFKSSSELVAKSPAGSGSAEITVKTAGGTSTTGTPDQFTYRAMPTVTTISPKEGPSAGGTSVTINGTNFTKTSEVRFGPNAATVEFKSSSELVAKTPAGSGTVDVFVKTAGGTATTGSGEEFTYRGPPAVTSVSPKEGGIAGATVVTIDGENLEAAKTVTFGGVSAKIKTDAVGVIEVESPAHAAGTVDIVVNTEGGSSPTHAADEFTYRGVPTVSAISPHEGPEAGGTSVKINGTGFTKTSEVSFGGKAAAEFEFKSSTEVVAKTPAGAGVVDVRVTSAGGTSTTSAADEFSYRGVPTVGAISPNEGPEAGGTAVTITGTNFTKASEVSFGSKAGTEMEFKSSTELVAKSPSGTAGVHVTVTTAGGTSSPSSASEFTYRGTPSITSVAPAEGLTEGGTMVTIKGEKLDKATQVKFGGALATILKDSSGEIEVSTPRQAPGPVEVCVVTPGGTICKPAAFTYKGPPPPKPVVTGVSPSEGSTAGTTKVKVSGSNLGGATVVAFGGTTAPNVLSDSEAEVEVETPAHAAGAVEVCVTTGGGTNCKAAAYTYVAPPTVGAPVPSEGPEAGGTHVLLIGSNLANATVEFGGTAAAKLKDTSGEVEVEAPPHAPGKVEVCVTTTGGKSCTATLFVYRGFPTISSLNPNEGAVGGGTTVTIKGEHLEGTSEVTFGAAKGLNLKVKSETELMINSPAGSGSVPVVVKTPGGQSAGTNEFSYRLAPSVSSVSPKEGGEGGGSVVTITGEHLAHATEVRFGTTKATGVEVLSETSVRATSPAHGPGFADVVVVTPGGQSPTNSNDRFLYIAKPLVKRVEPHEGRAGEQTTVTVTGEHLQSPSAVKFGGTSGTEVASITAGELKVKSPALEAGAVDVVVTTTVGGESGKSPVDRFTYVSPPPVPPKVFSISPTEGGSAGGAVVTIRGEGFSTPTAVFFGGVEASGVKVISSNELTVSSPPHGVGSVGIVVKTGGGESANTEADQFTYVQSPVTPTAVAAVVTTTSATTSATPPSPVLASTGNVAPVSGTVLVELPGTTTFVPLTTLKQIPFGTVIDATHGRVTVTTATPKGGTQTGEFFDGEFILTQGRGGLVIATLTGGNFAVCPRHGALKAGHASISASAKKASPKHVVRKLWANAHGSFSTKGNYAAGAVQGTEWLTEDLCEGTLIRVTRDKVAVTNLVTHHHLSVRAGRHYLAKAP